MLKKYKFHKGQELNSQNKSYEYYRAGDITAIHDDMNEVSYFYDYNGLHFDNRTPNGGVRVQGVKKEYIVDQKNNFELTRIYLASMLAHHV